LNSRDRRTGAFVTRAIAGETILVPVRRDVAQQESIYTMNDSAAAVWEGVSEGLDREALAERLVARFEVSPEEALADVGAFLEALAAEGLITR
jgi:hypothetical protein